MIMEGCKMPFVREWFNHQTIVLLRGNVLYFIDAYGTPVYWILQHTGIGNFNITKKGSSAKPQIVTNINILPTPVIHVCIHYTTCNHSARRLSENMLTIVLENISQQTSQLNNYNLCRQTNNKITVTTNIPKLLVLLSGWALWIVSLIYLCYM